MNDPTRNPDRSKRLAECRAEIKRKTIAGKEFWLSDMQTLAYEYQLDLSKVDKMIMEAKNAQ